MTEHTIRFANSNDVKLIKKLWIEVFNDEENFVDSFLEHLFSDVDTVVFEENSKIYSIASFIDVKIGEYKGKYLYALATSPRKRNKHLATSLIEFSKNYFSQNGYEFIITIPSNPKLIPFYEKNGFLNKTHKRTYFEDGMSFKIFPKYLNSKELYQIRQNSNKSPIYNPDFFEFIFEDLISDGWLALGYEDSYCVCKPNLESLLVREFSGKYSPICFANALGFNRAEINCYDGENVFAMYISFNNNIEISNIELMLEK